MDNIFALMLPSMCIYALGLPSMQVFCFMLPFMHVFSYMLSFMHVLGLPHLLHMTIHIYLVLALCLTLFMHIFGFVLLSHVTSHACLLSPSPVAGAPSQQTVYTSGRTLRV